jgi:hypothetical protein
MAIVISAGAGMVLGHLGGSMLDLSGRVGNVASGNLEIPGSMRSLSSGRSRWHRPGMTRLPAISPTTHVFCPNPPFIFSAGAAPIVRLSR